jgi:hypothetical protein
MITPFELALGKVGDGIQRFDRCHFQAVHYLACG